MAGAEVEQEEGKRVMKQDLKWLDDPEVFRVGKLPAHSDHVFYKDMEEMAELRVVI